MKIIRSVYSPAAVLVIFLVLILSFFLSPPTQAAFPELLICDSIPGSSWEGFCTIEIQESQIAVTYPGSTRLPDIAKYDSPNQTSTFIGKMLSRSYDGDIKYKLMVDLYQYDLDTLPRDGLFRVDVDQFLSSIYPSKGDILRGDRYSCHLAGACLKTLSH